MPPVPSKQTVRRKPGRPPSDLRGEDRRARLVDAALNAFAEHGYEGASLRDIAGRSGVDLALIRYYFGSKEDLWYGALRDLAERLGRDSRQAIGDDFDSLTATQRLERTIRWFVEISARFPYLSRIIVSESAQPGERQKFISQEIVGIFYGTMSSLIEEAKGEGTVPDVSTRTIFFMITHGGSFPMAIPALTNDMPGPDIRTPRAIQRHADAIVDLVIRKKV